jgi:hypothetical protein
VEASASVSLDGPAITEQLSGDLSLVAAAATIQRQIAAGEISDPCEALLFVPGPHLEGSSTPDDYNDCEGGSGSWTTRLAALARKYGPIIIATLTASYVLKSDGAPAPPPPVDANDPTAATKHGVGLHVTPDPTDVARVWPRIKQQSVNATATTYKVQSDADAEQLAQQCLSYVAEYLSVGGPNRCETEMIFAPGRNVQDAAQHDLEAIAGHPLWLELNYATSKTKRDQGNTRTWYQGGCGSYDTTVYQCDEYPYFASRQGGDLASPTPSLKPVLIGHNQDEGNFAGYAGFISWCKPSSDSTAGVGGTPFLVIPMTSDDAQNTLWSCGSSRSAGG